MSALFEACNQSWYYAVSAFMTPSSSHDVIHPRQVQCCITECSLNSTLSAKWCWHCRWPKEGEGRARAVQKGQHQHRQSGTAEARGCGKIPSRIEKVNVPSMFCVQTYHTVNGFVKCASSHWGTAIILQYCRRWHSSSVLVAWAYAELCFKFNCSALRGGRNVSCCWCCVGFQGCFELTQQMWHAFCLFLPAVVFVGDCADLTQATESANMLQAVFAVFECFLFCVAGSQVRDMLQGVGCT